MSTRRKEFAQRLKKAWEYALDTVAPPDPAVRRIERMSPAEFAAEARLGVAHEEIEGIASLLPYQGEAMKTALVELKSRANRRIARLLGAVACEMLAEELSDLAMFGNFTRPLLVPVPTTRKRRRERGWNQCELVVSEIRRADKAKVFEARFDILKKIRETADQVGKTRAERLENLKGVFAVKDPDLVRGRNVIVFDDIVTTGATLLEARRALCRAGAKKVVCVAIAH